jgi:hypothetical protein
MNLSSTIVPKSDQTNSDDLISGPRTIKITAVEPGTQDRQVFVSYEGDGGRPYVPSKSMRRVLVQIWGSEGGAYVGRRLTIYRDPTVKFGGDLVGGIKISHASHITEGVSLMLTATRGKRQAHRVDPLPDEVAVVLADLPQNWGTMTADERGENRASLGSKALKEWWGTLTVAERATLKPKLDATWKAQAEGVK